MCSSRVLLVALLLFISNIVCTADTFRRCRLMLNNRCKRCRIRTRRMANNEDESRPMCQTYEECAGKMQRCLERPGQRYKEKCSNFTDFADPDRLVRAEEKIKETCPMPVAVARLAETPTPGPTAAPTSCTDLEVQTFSFEIEWEMSVFCGTEDGVPGLGVGDRSALERGLLSYLNLEEECLSAADPVEDPCGVDNVYETISVDEFIPAEVCSEGVDGATTSSTDGERRLQKRKKSKGSGSGRGKCKRCKKRKKKNDRRLYIDSHNIFLRFDSVALANDTSVCSEEVSLADEFLRTGYPGFRDVVESSVEEFSNDIDCSENSASCKSTNICCGLSPTCSCAIPSKSRCEFWTGTESCILLDNDGDNLCCNTLSNFSLAYPACADTCALPPTPSPAPTLCSDIEEEDFFFTIDFELDNFCGTEDGLAGLQVPEKSALEQGILSYLTKNETCQSIDDGLDVDECGEDYVYEVATIDSFIPAESCTADESIGLLRRQLQRDKKSRGSAGGRGKCKKCRRKKKKKKDRMRFLADERIEAINLGTVDISSTYASQYAPNRRTQDDILCPKAPDLAEEFVATGFPGLENVTEANADQLDDDVDCSIYGQEYLVGVSCCGVNEYISCPEVSKSNCEYNSCFISDDFQSSNRCCEFDPDNPEELVHSVCNDACNVTFPPTLSPTAGPPTTPTLIPTSVTVSPTLVRKSDIPSTSTLPSLIRSISPTPQLSTSFRPTPTSSPTDGPTASPTDGPTASPTGAPTKGPTQVPPTLSPPPPPPPAPPTFTSTTRPSTTPSVSPNSSPTTRPSITPSALPSSKDSPLPSSQETLSPTIRPSTEPSIDPTLSTTMRPSAEPSIDPTSRSASPSITRSASPSLFPSETASLRPSRVPTASPTIPLYWDLLNDAVGNNNNLFGEVPGAEFGSVVAISDDGYVYAVGSPLYNDVNSVNSGLVQVFKLQGTDQKDNKGNPVFESRQIGQDLKGTKANQFFGFTLDIFGNNFDQYRLVIGSRNSTRTEVYLNVYEYFLFSSISPLWDFTSNITVRTAQINPQVRIASGEQGFGDTIALAGQVYVYNQNLTWGRVGEVIAASLQQSDFGRYTALASTEGVHVVAVSEVGDGGSTNFPVKDRVRVFERAFQDSTGPWTQRGQTIESSSASESAVVVSLSNDGSIIVIGAPSAVEPKGIGNIRVFSYDAQNRQWVQLGSDIEAEEGVTDFGRTVAISLDGSYVAASGISKDSSGFVSFYRIDENSFNGWAPWAPDLVGIPQSNFGSSFSLFLDNQRATPPDRTDPFRAIVAVGAPKVNVNQQIDVGAAYAYGLFPPE